MSSLNIYSYDGPFFAIAPPHWKIVKRGPDRTYEHAPNASTEASANVHRMGCSIAPAGVRHLSISTEIVHQQGFVEQVSPEFLHIRSDFIIPIKPSFPEILQTDLGTNYKCWRETSAVKCSRYSTENWTLLQRVLIFMLVMNLFCVQL